MLDQAKGGVATAWMLREMKARGIVPLALVFNRVNPILAQGAAFGGVAMVDRFDDGDVTDLIRTGDTLRIDPAAGLVEILNRGHGVGPAMSDLRITAGPYTVSERDCEHDARATHMRSASRQTGLRRSGWRPASMCA